MMPTSTPDVESNDAFDRRQRRLFVIAWGATLLPLVPFTYLTWQSYVLNRDVQEAQARLDAARTELLRVEAQKNKAVADLAETEGKLETQRSVAKEYRRLSNIKVRFYRESDRAVVEQALLGLGFVVDARLGQSPLISRQPNTIAYGKSVPLDDLWDMAIALVKAGFPLKRVTPAVRQPDPELIQIYASAESDATCGLLTVELLEKRSTCGPRTGP